MLPSNRLKIGAKPTDREFNDCPLGCSLIHRFLYDTRCHSELACSPNNSPVMSLFKYPLHLKGGSVKPMSMITHCKNVIHVYEFISVLQHYKLQIYRNTNIIDIVHILPFILENQGEGAMPVASVGMQALPSGNKRRIARNSIVHRPIVDGQPTHGSGRNVVYDLLLVRFRAIVDVVEVEVGEVELPALDECATRGDFVVGGHVWFGS